MTKTLEYLEPKDQLSDEEAATLGKECFDYIKTEKQRLPAYPAKGGMLIVWKGKVLKFACCGDGPEWAHIGDEMIQPIH